MPLQGSPLLKKMAEANGFRGKLSGNLNLTAASGGGGSSEDGEKEGVRMCCYLGEQLRVEWLDCGSRLKIRVVETNENGLRGASFLFVLAACQRRHFKP